MDPFDRVLGHQTARLRRLPNTATASDALVITPNVAPAEASARLA